MLQMWIVSLQRYGTHNNNCLQKSTSFSFTFLYLPPNFTVIGVSKPLGLEKDRKAHPNSAAHPSKKATAANIDVSIA